MPRTSEFPNSDNLAALVRYYRFHSRIYDASRWLFLFGRSRLIQMLPTYCQPNHILEVGCGTGKNLLHLHRIFPNASLAGLDLSPAMLDRARTKMARQDHVPEFIQQAYDRPIAPDVPYDLLVFSYTLSMFNASWRQAIGSAYADLRPGGAVAVVDFHDLPVAVFKKWMACNHVHMQGHLLPELRSGFHTRFCEIYPAYGGLWTYFRFIGEKVERPFSDVGSLISKTAGKT